jgi:putative flippase GtrA
MPQKHHSKPTKKISMALKLELAKFTLIGIAAVAVDLVCYYALLELFGDSTPDQLSHESVAKAISFLCGMTVTYTANKYWTWKKSDRSKLRVAKFSLLYGISLCVNVGSNYLLIKNLPEIITFPEGKHVYFAAFIGATLISASMNFVGQKLWVFK